MKKQCFVLSALYLVLCTLIAYPKSRFEFRATLVPEKQSTKLKGPSTQFQMKNPALNNAGLQVV
jgi:hypothetical protein